MLRTSPANMLRTSPANTLRTSPANMLRTSPVKTLRTSPVNMATATSPWSAASKMPMTGPVTSRLRIATAGSYPLMS